MNPTSELTSFVIGKIADQLLSIFQRSVVDRWSRKRAEAFFDAFAAGLANGSATANDVSANLTAILADERNSEVLFDAYRRVCLSRSKVIGPRATGLLTAQIVSENRMATGFEERWFEVFETCTDEELKDLSEYYGMAFSHARNGTNDSYRVKFNTLVYEFEDRTTPLTGDINHTPVNLHEFLGSWAAKLQRLGMIRVETREKTWSKNPLVTEATHADLARKVTHRISFDLPDEEYAALIRRAIPREPASPAV